MANHTFLKSIKPVNLLSFGPNTEEIELRPLNILIGPNGSGKSNLIEVVGLLKELPDRDPWSIIKRSGADEWIWKDRKQKLSAAHIECTVSLNESVGLTYRYSLSISSFPPPLKVWQETLKPLNVEGKSLERTAFDAQVLSPSEMRRIQQGVLDPERSILSQLHAVASELAEKDSPKVGEIADFFSRMAFYRDWEFGVSSEPREAQSSSERSNYLEEDGRNLAHVLNALRTGVNFGLRDRLKYLLSQFYECAEDIDIELLGGRVQLRMLETSGISTPAGRLSDGTLRWLALLAILLNPTPPPVTCIEEPELGLHPDAIHTLADLLRDASTRTQLIVTTHSDALVDAFTDDPESVCVCEKVDGSTTIRRLEKERLKVWLEDYSLGKLWMSGEIGGNRW